VDDVPARTQVTKVGVTHFHLNRAGPTGQDANMYALRVESLLSTTAAFVKISSTPMLDAAKAAHGLENAIWSLDFAVDGAGGASASRRWACIGQAIYVTELLLRRPARGDPVPRNFAAEMRANVIPSLTRLHEAILTIAQLSKQQLVIRKDLIWIWNYLAQEKILVEELEDADVIDTLGWQALASAKQDLTVENPTVERSSVVTLIQLAVLDIFNLIISHGSYESKAAVLDSVLLTEDEFSAATTMLRSWFPGVRRSMAELIIRAAEHIDEDDSSEWGGAAEALAHLKPVIISALADEEKLHIRAGLERALEHFDPDEFDDDTYDDEYYGD